MTRPRKALNPRSRRSHGGATPSSLRDGAAAGRSIRKARVALCLLLLLGLGCAHPRARWSTVMGAFDDELPADVVYRVQTEAPLIALSLDDGPDPETTPLLLEILARHDARATFFVLGERAQRHPDLLAQIAAAGHELGNHLMSDEPSIELPTAEYEEQIEETSAMLRPYGRVRWVRPGSAWYDARMLRATRKLGYGLALGNLYPLDAQIPSANWIKFWMRSRASRGDVIVLHDTGKRGLRTAEVLEAVLPELVAEGLRVVTVSELVDSGHAADSEAAGGL